MNKDFYIELIYKSLAEGLSTEEQHQLDDWVKASDEHQETAQNIQQGWELSANYSKDIEVNLDDEFARLQESMNVDTPQSKASPLKVVKTTQEKKISPWKTWMSIAATVLLLATTYFVFNPTSSDPVHFVTVETQANEIKEVELADGTKVWVNENSTFTYPDKFTKHNRKVELKGLAFFDVERDEKKPFSIQTKEVEVRVLGTSFSVRDIDSESKVEVFVKTGKVQVTTNKNNMRGILRANDKGTYDKNSGKLTVGEKASTNELSWQTKTLIFDDVPLTKVISDVEKYYGIVLNLKDSNLAECPFNSIFKNKTLTEVFDAIGDVFKIEIEKTDDYVYDLKGGQCNVN